jgi:hypothetical protein
MNEYSSPPGPVEPAPPSVGVSGAEGSGAAVLPARTGIAPWARIGLLGIAAAALVAVAILAFGSTAAPTGTLAAGANNDGGSYAINDLNGGGPGGPGGPGFRGGFGHGGITITAISGNSISLKTEDGWTRTITVDSGTTYSKSGDTIALGDLKVGDQVGFRQTKEDDGTFTIDQIAVILPHVGGEVTAINGNTISLKLRDDSTTTVKVDGNTEFQVNGDNAALADVKVGMVLVAEGTENSDGSINASDVRAGDMRDGFGGRGFRGFGGPHFGPGPDGPWGEKPDASAVPSATGSAT